VGVGGGGGGGVVGGGLLDSAMLSPPHAPPHSAHPQTAHLSDLSAASRLYCGAGWFLMRPERRLSASWMMRRSAGLRWAGRFACLGCCCLRVGGREAVFV
jgi:hypothetical protein